MTLLSTGPNSARDIAGNSASPAASDQFAVAVPLLAHNLFVGDASFVTDPTAALGNRANPYPDDHRGDDGGVGRRRGGSPARRLHRAGDDEAVRRDCSRLTSSSTDSTVFTTSTGDAHETIIRASVRGQCTGGQLRHGDRRPDSRASSASAPRSRASRSPARWSATRPAARSTRTRSLLRSRIRTSWSTRTTSSTRGTGIAITTSGDTALTPMIDNDGIIGNITGITITDDGSTAVDQSRRTHQQQLRLQHDRAVAEQLRRARRSRRTSPTTSSGRTTTSRWRRSGVCDLLGERRTSSRAEQPVLGNGATDGRLRRGEHHSERIQPEALGPTASDAAAISATSPANPAFVSPRPAARLRRPGDVLP